MVQTAAIFTTLALAGTVAALPPRIGITVPNQAPIHGIGGARTAPIPNRGPFQPGPHGIPSHTPVLARDVDAELEARFGGLGEHGHGPVKTRIGLAGAPSRIIPFVQPLKVGVKVAEKLPEVGHAIHSFWDKHISHKHKSRDVNFDDELFAREVDELEARGGAGGAIKVGVKVAEKLPEVGHAIHSFWDKHISHKHKSRNVDFDEELLAREVDELEARGGAGGLVKVGVKVAEHAPDVGHAIHSFWDKHVSHKARDLDFEDNLFARDDYELEARKGGKGGGHGGSAIGAAVSVAENAPGVISGVKGWWNKHVSHKARDLDFEDDLFARDEELLEARDEDVEALFARYYEELDQLE